MPRTPTLTCASCDRPMWVGSGSLPQGEATCLACRRVNPIHKAEPRTSRQLCESCGLPSWGVQHRACRYPHAGSRSPSDTAAHMRRRARELAAPGLGRSAIAALRMRWIRQGRRCTYCPMVATQVDHVIPIALGGTNREGNLTPACRDCNTRKSDSLIVEWRARSDAPPSTLDV